MTGILVALSLLLAAAVNSQTITHRPLNTTTLIGDDVRINCTVEGDGDDLLTWNEMISNPLGALIFHSEMAGSNDPDEYEITGHYDLVVRKADLIDAGWYTCGLDSMPTPYPAYLIVTESPVVLANDLLEGRQSSMGCHVRYAAPKQFIQAGQLPRLQASIGNTIVTEVLSEVNDDIQREAQTMLHLTFNYTAHPDDDGLYLNCTVITENPFFKVNTSKKLNIKHKVSEIYFPGHKSTLKVGEYIMCASNGNPTPTYKWTAVKSPGSRVITGPRLEAMPNMVGSNTWECQAINDANGVATVTDTVEFNVVDPSPPSAAITTVSSTLAIFSLAIALFLSF